MQASLFNRALSNTKVSVARDYSADSSKLLLSFGGIRGRSGMTPFEFFNLTSDLAIKRLFIRDIHQSWYHAGLENISEDIHSSHEFLRQELNSLALSRVVIVGNSAGGFAAILFGLWLNVDVVHVFAPQTFMSPFSRLRYGDFRWPIESLRLYTSLLAKKSVLNLKPLLLNFRGKTRFHIHYGSENRLDSHHALYLSDIPHVTLHPYQSQSHAFIKDLKQSGELKALLLSAIME
jgi:hypothetical protein